VAVTELRDHENSVMGGPPARPLRPWVNDLYIYRETTGRPMRRREVPRPHVVMILDLGPSLRFLDPATRRFRGRYPGGWIAGLHERHVLTETEGRQEGVYVSFTPLGARRLLGVPMAELAHRVVTLDDVLGPAADRLLDRMASIGDPYRCLALLERLLMARLAEAPPVSAAVACAWQRITASGGNLGIGQLARELDWSRKHLVARFSLEVGLPPKRFARIVRFNRAMAVLEDGDAINLADLAAAAGYYDQAHMAREFRTFSGSPPSEFPKLRLVGENGMLDASADPPPR